MKQQRARGVSAATRQISQEFRIGRVQVGLIPVVAAHSGVLGDVEFALIKCEPVRLGQAIHHHHRSLRLASMFRVGQSDDLAFVGLANQQHTAGAENHHPGGIRLGEYGNVKSIRQFQPSKVRTALLCMGAGCKQQQ